MRIRMQSITRGREPMSWLWEMRNAACREKGSVVTSSILDFNTGMSITSGQFNDIIREVFLEAEALRLYDCPKLSGY